MKMFLKILSYLLVAELAVLGTVLVLNGLPSGDTKLDELSKIIDTYFVEDADQAALEDAAAEAMVNALGNRWSHYMTAEEYASYVERMANAYVGIGVTITQREDGYIDVQSVTGPAQEAGILAGDVITQVDGQDISGMDMDGIGALVRGPEGTTVDITLLRGHRRITYTVARRTIETVVTTWEMLEDGIGLVKINNFDSRCADETIAAVEALLAQDARALIFDVRFNPGGYKDEMVKILDYLLPEGPLFRSVDYAGREEVDTSDEACLDIPMAVLMNGDSYSAAELFAAALWEYEAAVLVGQPTTGKGHFQTSFRLSDGSAVVLSIGTYCTPNGVDLDGVGLTPDIPVEVDEQTYADIYSGLVSHGEDPQLQAAINALKNG